MTNGMEIARRLIAEEREKQTGFLDLGNLALTELPEELFELTELRGLNLGFLYVDEHGELQGVSNILENNALIEIPAGISALRKLEALYLSSNPISDLNGLRRLTALRSLDCSDTALTDLTSLPPLPSLHHLDFSGTRIIDLTPLAGYIGLENLSFHRTQVCDLSPLRALKGLQQLNFSASRITDLTPLEALENLRELTFVGADVKNILPIQGLVKLAALQIDGTPIDDLTPLCHLSWLKSVSCRGTKLQDLSPLSKLSAMVELNFGDTVVADLSPLHGLACLETLDCSGTPITDWQPLQSLTALKTLNVSDTSFSDLNRLQHLSGLQNLDCSFTEVSDFSPIEALPALRILSCQNTSISDLRPLKSLVNLEQLFINDTDVIDLGPLQTHPALQDLNCSRSGIHDLTPLIDLPWLQYLWADGCALDDIPRELVFSEVLCYLTLHETSIPGIPPEVLSDESYFNCLQSLRSHLRDLEAGTEPIRQTKLVVLGNGRVGKTQLCRHLRGMPFDETIPSTHGITVTSERWAGVERADGDETFNIWDFGGQDIYHGAHTLFMKTSAVFVIVWHPEFEDSGEETAGGLTFRNYPLSYWLEYVRTLGRKDSPVIVVQSRCERPEQEVRWLPVDEALLDLSFIRQCSFSAKTGRGKGTLNDALQDAVATLRQRDGITTIGKGRMTVLQQLER